MKGMIKKDFLMIANNKKALLVALLLYVVYTFMFDVDMSFFLPIMGMITCISTISYDDYNNWHTYASSLPQGRENVVRSKYIVAIIMILATAVFSLICTYFIKMIKPDIITGNNFEIIFGAIMGVAIIMSIMYPITINFGAGKGRLAIIITGLGFYGLFMLATEVLHIKITPNTLEFLDTYFPYIASVVTIVIISISYLISKKLYLKKEF